MNLLFTLMLFATIASDNWQPVVVPTTANLRGLSAVSEDVVWASGTNGAIIRTLDGGKNWKVISVPGAEKLDFRGIRAFDATTAVAMSSGKAEDGQARIYRTSDGGVSWSLVYQVNTPGVFFDAIAFWNRRHGIVLSDPVDGRFVLFTTDDGGATWRRLPEAAMPPALPGEGAFAASNSCLTVHGDSSVWFGTGGANVARIFYSKDRGQTWAVTETPIKPGNASSGIFSLVFHDERRGVAAGGDYTRPGDSPAPNVIFTIDGGQTWHAAGATEPAGLYLSSITYQPDSGSTVPSSTGTVVAAGPGGIDAASPGGKWVNETHEGFNAVAFPSFRVGWAVGPKGTVARWSAKTTQSWATDENPHSLLQTAQQAVVVVAPNLDSVPATLTRYERVAGKWQRLGDMVPVVLGRNGLAWDASLAHELGTGATAKREGDGRSPAGIFSLREVFGFDAKAPNGNMPYRVISADTECVDDITSFSYNRILDRLQVAIPDGNSAEHMRGIEGYREGAVVGYNDAQLPVPGRGSCIFLHIWDELQRPTSGCTAMASDKLGELIRWLDRGKQPILIQLPETEYSRIRDEWRWPLP